MQEATRGTYSGKARRGRQAVSDKRFNLLHAVAASMTALSFAVDGVFGLFFRRSTV